jgi:hypothetical protein
MEAHNMATESGVMPQVGMLARARNRVGWIAHVDTHPGHKDGRLTGRGVIVVWDETGGFYGILERLAQEPLENDARYLLVNGDAPVDDIVRAVMAHLSDPGQQGSAQ